jgi:diaminopimelate epimerase
VPHSHLVWLKGHGTRNDFVLLPDEDGDRYPELDAGTVAWLCDRAEGLGADGVIRVTRAAHVRGLDSQPESRITPDSWFMDYRNADGSIAEMCGNGVRVLAHYLHTHLDVALPLIVGTRGGAVAVAAAEVVGEYTVSMGEPLPIPVSEPVHVVSEGRRHAGVGVHLPNPHAVVFVPDLAEAGSLREVPTVTPASAYPSGSNVEYVTRRGERWIAMRVHERGVGETQSCGTGACAAAWAAMVADGGGPGETYRVDVPGGTLQVTWEADGTMSLTGPAVITAAGEITRCRDERGALWLAEEARAT